MTRIEEPSCSLSHLSGTVVQADGDAVKLTRLDIQMNDAFSRTLRQTRPPTLDTPPKTAGPNPKKEVKVAWEEQFTG